MIKIFKAYKLFSVTAFSLTGLAHDYNIQLKTTRWGSILRVWQDTKYEEADTMPTVPASTLIEKKPILNATIFHSPCDLKSTIQKFQSYIMTSNRCSSLLHSYTILRITELGNPTSLGSTRHHQLVPSNTRPWHCQH